MSAQNQNWCFTLNNYTDEQVLHLQLLAEDPRVAYLVIGREVAPTTGTPHIQGFVRFNSRLRLSSVRALLPVCHCTSARGTAEQNRIYCIKDGDFDEWGTCPVDQQGRRSDFERYVEWLRTLESEPSERELIDQWPSLYGRYRGALRRMAGEICPRPTLRDGESASGKQLFLQSLMDRPMTEQFDSSSTATEDTVSLGSVDTPSQSSMESRSWVQGSVMTLLTPSTSEPGSFCSTSPEGTQSI